MTDWPLILEPEDLERHLGANELLVVDLRTVERYAQSHVPGAVHLEPASIQAKLPPVGGLLPSDEVLGTVLGGIGLTADTHVVAYDDEGGGWAGRLLWTLDVVGHPQGSLLNGGWRAWHDEGFPVETQSVRPIASTYSPNRGDQHLCDTDYVLANLGHADIALLDTRSAEEFSGQKRLAAKGGHIPGAVNMDWVLAMDQERGLRLKSEPVLRDMLESLAVTPNKEVIVYCQTHHRSSHTYVMLKSLGYSRLKGYPGAWSEWGNRTDTPVEG